MKTQRELITLLKSGQRGHRRGHPLTFRESGPLQCSVGYISGFASNLKAIDSFCRGFIQQEYAYDNPPLLKKRWPAIWLFTVTKRQEGYQFTQDIICGLNAVVLYEYKHTAHGNNMCLYMADPKYFNYDFMYDLCEQQLKEEGSIK